MRVGPTVSLKKVRPLILGPDLEPLFRSLLGLFSLPRDEVVPVHAMGLGDASTERVSAVVQSDLLKCVEPVSESPVLASLLSVVFDGFSDKPSEGLTFCGGVSD